MPDQGECVTLACRVLLSAGPEQEFSVPGVLTVCILGGLIGREVRFEFVCTFTHAREKGESACGLADPESEHGRKISEQRGYFFLGNPFSKYYSMMALRISAAC
jgi:hypothetical protein